MSSTASLALPAKINDVKEKFTEDVSDHQVYSLAIELFFNDLNILLSMERNTLCFSANVNPI